MILRFSLEGLPDRFGDLSSTSTSLLSALALKTPVSESCSAARPTHLIADELSDAFYTALELLHARPELVFELISLDKPMHHL